jgi:cell division septal protein FtsQ
MEKSKKQISLDEEEESAEPQHRTFPVTWALALLFMWIFMSSAIFCWWTEQQWDYFTSVYFFFISIRLEII